MARILVERSSAIDAANAQGYGARDNWVTTSPFAYEALRLKPFPVEWIDAPVDSAHVHDAGRVALAVVDAIADQLLAAEEEMDWPRVRILVAMRVHPLMCALVSKAKLMERFLQSDVDEKVVVGSVLASEMAPATLGVGRYDTLFAIFAAELNDPNLTIVEHLADAGSLSQLSDRPTLMTRLVSLANLTPSLLLWRLWKLLGYPVLKLGSGEKHIIVDGDNEALREMFPKLLVSGSKISFLRKYRSYRSHIEPGATPLSIDVARLADAMRRCLHENGVVGLADIVANMAASRIATFFAYLSEIQKAGDAVYEEAVSEPKTTFLLAGNAGSLVGHATGARLVGAGGKTALAQHGASAGMSRYHGYFEHISEARTADFYLVNAPAASALYNDADDPKGWSIQANASLEIGLPHETAAIPARGFQRALTRKWLGVRPGDRAVMAVIGTYQNNMLYQPGMPNDRTAHDWYMALAHDVLPKVRGQPILKLYSTYRFVDPDPLERLRRAPDPVVTIKDGDFRFMRAAADIVIFDSSLSTIGWAFGAGCPLVYLYNPAFQLFDDARTMLEAAVFFIDTSEAGWDATLLSILNQSDSEIGAQWRAKEQGRERFVARFIATDRSPGRSVPDLLEKVFEAAC